MNRNLQNNSSDYFNKQYIIHRANELLRYGWIKMLLGSAIVLFYAWSDIYIKHNYLSSFFRFIPIFASFLFIALHLLLFKRSKALVLMFYNFFYLALIIMMYSIVIVDHNSPYFTQSTEGALLVLAIATVELRGRFVTFLMIYLIPVFCLGILLLLGSKITKLELMLMVHQITFAFIGIVYCTIKERISFDAFKTQLNLEIEKKKTDELVNSLTEYTEEIKSQKEEISVQRDQAESQRLLLEIQKQEQQSNLSYASRIQLSLLPTTEILKKNFDDFFVIIKPRDIVSGDFYWSAKVGDWTYFAVADCTGHGVSAAFMSILGITFLNETIREFEGLTPGLILNRLRNLIVETLHQSSETINNQDGMDISLCAYNSLSRRLIFAGANSSMLLIRNNAFIPEIKHVKGDKMPVSVYLRMDSFTNQEFQIQSGDQVYLYSDGFADQFGGPKGKKLKLRHFKDLIVQNSNLTMREQKKMLTQFLDKWTSQHHERYEQTDDIMVLGLKFNSTSSANL
jgi:serine phosphatase RsbU (regulator of sigma subunit)